MQRLQSEAGFRPTKTPELNTIPDPHFCTKTLPLEGLSHYAARAHSLRRVASVKRVKPGLRGGDCRGAPARRIPKIEPLEARRLLTVTIDDGAASGYSEGLATGGPLLANAAAETAPDATADSAGNL